MSELKDLIGLADICGHVPLIKGLHGLGKSEVVAQYALENNMYYEPLILSLMDTGDLLGLPNEKVVGGVSSTIWAAPSWYTNIVNAAWPKDLPIDRLQFNDERFHDYFFRSHQTEDIVDRGVLNTKFCEYFKLPDDRLQLLRQDSVEFLDSRRSVLNLDEFNRANQDILNASLQLILDHRLHSHILPVIRGQETLIVAAINPADGNYSVQEFDPALLDRFVECEVLPDFKSWHKWAKGKVNQIVIDFLIDNENKFHFTPKDGSKGASPRSWTRLSSFVDKMDKVSKNTATNYVKGTVGTALAAQFLHFYNNYQSMTSLDDLIKIVTKEANKLENAGEEQNPEVISEAIKKEVSEMEVIRRSEFAETLIKRYINKDDYEDALPMLAFFYALPLEGLSASLKSLQLTDIGQYAKLAKLDKKANDKALFKKIIIHAK